MFNPFIKTSLLKASKIATSKFGKVTSTTKGNDNNQVLTEADIQIGKFLIAKINEKFPDHNIIDEEAGVINNKSSFTWVIDPIDGTSNFASGVPTYGIMLGLLKEYVPIASGVILPEFKDLYVCEKGEGTKKNNKNINVTNEKDLLSTLVAYTIDSHREKPATTKKECEDLAKIILEIRNLRASGSIYDGILVAEGKYGGYLNKTSKIWDNVALHVMIEEAGGLYTDFEGNKISYKNCLSDIEKNYTFCAASPTLHSQLQQIINNS